MSDFLKSQAEKNQETAAKGPQDEPEDLSDLDPQERAAVEGMQKELEGEDDPRAIKPTPQGPPKDKEPEPDEPDDTTPEPGNQVEGWTPYERQGTIECYPYKEGQSMEGISVSPEDTPEEGGMIARNMDNPNDQWYINPDYFHKNYLPLFEDRETSDEDEEISTGRSEKADLKRENEALKVRIRNLNRQLQNHRPEIGRR